MSLKRVGVIGGGQLAWMMGTEAKALDIELTVQTPSPQDPAVAVAREAIHAPVDEAMATAQLAARCEVITFENEFIDLPGLSKLAEEGICFRPSLKALSPLLDKYEQRSFLKNIGLPVPKFILLKPGQEITSPFGFPAVLKARRHGYDGKGTFIVQSQDELTNTWEALGSPDILLEEYVPFQQELGVMAARSLTGKIITYPVVETQQVEQVCRRVVAPAQVKPEVVSQVQVIATTLLEKLQVVGIFGIELFLTADDQVLVNEIAPRTHNSGHFTLDACETSQFAMQLQTVADLPLGSPHMKCPGAVMVNLLGYETSESDYQGKRNQLQGIPQTYVYWYGKTQSRPGRKLGHVTTLLDSSDRGAALAMAKVIESIWYGKKS